MAGSILLGEQIWSTSGAIFYWLLDHVRIRLDYSDERIMLEEVIDNNIGILSLDSLRAGQREAILEAMLAVLSADVSELSRNAPNFDAVVRSLDELRTMVELDLTG